MNCPCLYYLPHELCLICKVMASIERAKREVKENKKRLGEMERQRNEQKGI